MYPVIVPLGRVLRALADVDVQLAHDVQALGCPRCGGPLHQANWRRKPRGAADELLEGCATRWGLCCGTCRRRTLPPSVVFCGRHVYIKAVMLLVVAARQRGLSSTSMAELQKLHGVSAGTIRRWIRVFLERLPKAPTWLRARGRVGAGIRDADVPAAFLDALMATKPGDAAVLVSACRALPAL